MIAFGEKNYYYFIYDVSQIIKHWIIKSWSQAEG